MKKKCLSLFIINFAAIPIHSCLAPHVVSSELCSLGERCHHVSADVHSIFSLDHGVENPDSRSLSSGFIPTTVSSLTPLDRAGNFHSTAGPSPWINDTTASPDDVFILHRTLGSAVPISSGVPFYPSAAAISSNLRSQILTGDDINFVKILLCSYFSD